MEYERWIGSHDWKRSDDVIDGYPSRNERNQTDTLDLDDLIHWLEYAHTGFPAARHSIQQEEHWAELIRNMLCEKLVHQLIFFEDNTFECRCNHCNNIIRGNVYDDITVTISFGCDCITPRELDISAYILNQYGEWK